MADLSLGRRLCNDRRTVYVVIDLALFFVAAWAVWGIGIERHWWRKRGEQILLGTLILIAMGVFSTALGLFVRWIGKSHAAR